VSQIEMKRQLTAVKMGEKDNPTTMFKKFHWLANLFNNPATGGVISSDDIMARVFTAAPDHYQSVLNSGSRSKGAQLTLHDLEQTMTQMYWATYASGKDKVNKNEHESKSGEVVLANPS
jgi:hypothetical protein